MRKEVTLATIAVLSLVFLGAVMVFSASAFRNDDLPIIYKHAFYVVVGLGAFFFFARFDYHHFQDPVIRRLIGIGAVAVLLIVLVIGTEVDGGKRWIRFGPVGFQPSECARVALIILLAVQLTRHRARVGEFWRGFLPPFLMAVVVSALVVAQRDMGIPPMMMLVTWAMMFVAGVRLRYLLAPAPFAVAALVFLIKDADHRMARLIAFLNPWDYREEAGWQLIQSMSAFAQGGWFGRGAGAGEQKLGYLPAAHTDFIFAVVGEELGLIGTLATVGVFICITIAGVRIAMNASDYFGSLLASGITAYIALQAAFIMGVTTGLLPTKGLPLPFVSYGGTALIMYLAAAGMLVNVGAQAPVIVERRLVPAPPSPQAA